MASSPKGGLYALATSLGVYVYPIDASEPERFWSFDSPVYSVAFDRDGTHLAAGDWRGTISIIDLGTGAIERRPGAHPRAIRSIAYSPDGQMLASGSEDGTATWRITYWSPRAEDPGSGSPRPLRRSFFPLEVPIHKTNQMGSRGD